MLRNLMAALAATAMLAASGAAVLARSPDPADWEAVLAEARGQTAYWYAWGGSNAVNDYIAWAAAEVEARYGVAVEHVKLADTADAVSRVIAEKTAGKDEGGAVDLIWINGENFASMKQQGLLFGPWAEQLPNWRFVDVEGKPTVVLDFTVPTEGMEAPWGMAQIVFYYDTARLAEPPRSSLELLAWAQRNPGRFAFPQPPDFLGSTFLKQVLTELAPDPAVLQQPVDEAGNSVLIAALWDYMAALTPNLWRGGKAYPQSGPRLIQLMADGEIDIALSFSPNEASNAIANQELPDTVRTYVHEAGTIGNASFVAIPYNASAKAGAMVLANFLLSPEAQARMADPAIWGSGTVLAVDRLPPEERARFEGLRLGIATLSPEELGAALPEPHASWMVYLEKQWIARFGVVQ
jgi:putative thiamine transport system substrate-binding protein